MADAPAQPSVMEQIVSLCKRRGFVYPASEIYGGLNGFWDYGPLGVLLKNNVRDWWWQNLVLSPPIGPDGHPVDIVGLDSSIIQNPKTWIASGHVGGFSDPMIDDKVSKKRFRADHLWVFFPHTVGQQKRFGIAVEAASLAEALATFDKKDDSGSLSKIYKDAQRRFGFDPSIAREIGAKAATQLSESEREGIYVPGSAEVGFLTEPRAFNLMFITYVGAIQDESAKVYLRPETAQGIFLNYKNVIDTMRVKVPFGVAQVGKSFRNEVTPRNFIFRSREFEQMELEWFCHPDEARKWFDFWLAERMRWWRSLGVKEENLRIRQHDADELSHYAKAGVGTADIEYKYPFTAPDFGELEGVAHRTDFDLKAHEEHSGQRLDYFDQDLQVELKGQGVADEEIKRRSRYHPHVIEPASGLTRAVLVLLCEGFTPDESRPSKMYMRFHPKFAPIKCGIFPLVNKDGMPEIAEKLYLDLRNHFTCEYDAKQTVGKRYARMDEIGTPFCVTVDGQTKDDQTVTVRERDTMRQERVSLEKVLPYLRERLSV